MDNSIVLNESTVMSYLESEVEFPVDFDQAWQWAGYSTKHKALLKLKKHFSVGEEFTTRKLKNSSAGRPSDLYFLTNDCFKMFCMMAGTEKGVEVRRYYIQCEKTLKAQRQQATTPALPSYAQEIHILTDALRILKLEDSPRHLPNLRGFGRTQAKPGASARGCSSRVSQVSVNEHSEYTNT